MKTHINNRIAIAFIIALLILGSMFLLSNTFATVTGVGCGPPEKPCDMEKATIEATIFAEVKQTTEAKPTDDTRVVGVVTPQPNETVGIIDTLPPITIRPVTGDDVAGVGAFRGASSIWIVGTLPSAEGYGNGLVHVIARRGDDNTPAQIGYYVLGNWPTDEWKQYRGSWPAPKDVGEITITNVTGLVGMVLFTTSFGVKGSFNLTTHEWKLSR